MSVSQVGPGVTIGAVATYEFRVEVTEGEEAPEIPVWDDLDLLQAIGSFHEWMNYALSHEQRLSTRFFLHRTDDPGG